MASTVWQSQPSVTSNISLGFIRAMSAKLDADWRHQKRVMVAAVALAVIVCVVSFLKAFLANPETPIPSGMRMTTMWSAVLALVAALYVVWDGMRRGRLISEDARAPGATLEAYRQEMLRRRNYYDSATQLWRIWPAVPCLLVVYVRGFLYDQRPGKAVRYTLLALFLALFIVGALGHHRRRARELQLELEALDALQADRTVRNTDAS